MTKSIPSKMNASLTQSLVRYSRLLSGLRVLCLLTVATFMAGQQAAHAQQDQSSQLPDSFGAVLTDLQVTVHDHKLVPGTVAFNTVLKQLPGYERVGVDLNENAGGKFIYLWQKRERNAVVDNCITKIYIVDGENKHLGKTRGKETVLPINLNEGTKSGATFIYLGFSRIGTTQRIVGTEFISEVNVVAHQEVKVARNSLGQGWEITKYEDGRNSADLNVGAGGDYIYLFARRAFAP